MKPGDMVCLLDAISSQVRLLANPSRDWKSLLPKRNVVSSREVCVILDFNCGYLNVMNSTGAQGWVPTSYMKVIK